METFKFRAECWVDVATFVHNLGVSFRKITVERTDPFPDVVAEVTVAEMTLQDVKEVAGLVEDGQVMVETLATVAEYTGERK